MMGHGEIWNLELLILLLLFSLGTEFRAKFAQTSRNEEQKQKYIFKFNPLSTHLFEIFFARGAHLILWAWKSSRFYAKINLFHIVHYIYYINKDEHVKYCQFQRIRTSCASLAKQMHDVLVRQMCSKG